MFEQFDVRAIKVGMLANADITSVIIKALKRHNPAGTIPVVVDPVIRTSNEGIALEEQGVRLMREKLLPLATLVKPNLCEAALLLGEFVASNIEQMRGQVRRLGEFGSLYTLLSGGHLSGGAAVDILFDGLDTHVFSAPKIQSADVHGTGCTLTSAIAANLARGHSPREAVELAKKYLHELLKQPFQLDRKGLARSLDHQNKRVVPIENRKA